MKRLPFLTLAGILAIALLTTTTGCPKKDEPAPKPDDKGAKGDKGAKDKGGKMEALAKNWDAVVKGKVTYNGEPPTMPAIKGISEDKFKPVCEAGAKDFEKVQQTWMVGKDKAVKNAVIWLKPPAKKYFVVKDEDKKRTDTVVLEQPHCAFIPHVFVLYPSYYDGKDHVKTGQIFKVINNASALHNSKIQGEQGINEPQNISLPPTKEKEVDLAPQKSKITVNCDIHPWMSAYGWVFEHPYAAVTGEDGTFEIKNVPADVELFVVGWHEGTEFFEKGKAMTFKKGDNTVPEF